MGKCELGREEMAPASQELAKKVEQRASENS